MWNRLVEAVSKNDHETIGLLMKQSPEVIKKKSGSNETLLHFAVKAGNEELVKKLLHSGLNSNEGDDYNWTPMHEAASMENEKILALLLAKKGSPDVVSQKKELPLHVACRKGFKRHAEMLVKAGSSVVWPAEEDMTPLHEAAISGEVEIIQLLLKEGAKINAPTKKKETPLHLSARMGRVKTARFLIDNGADKDRFDHLGKRFLDIAKDWHQSKFLEAFADPTAQGEADKKMSTGEIAAETASILSEKLGENLLAFFTPYIIWGGACFVTLLVLNHGLNFLANQFMPSAAIPVGGSSGVKIQFAYMFYKGKGILGTDIPLTWWFFNGAVVLGFLTRYSANPREKWVIYQLVVVLLSFHALTPVPSPIVSVVAGRQMAGAEPEFLGTLRDLTKPGNLFGNLKPTTAQQMQDAGAKVQDVQKNLDNVDNQIRKSAGS